MNEATMFSSSWFVDVGELPMNGTHIAMLEVPALSNAVSIFIMCCSNTGSIVVVSVMPLLDSICVSTPLMNALLFVVFVFVVSNW